MGLKSIIKTIKSLINHPIVGSYLFFHGTRKLDLLPQMSINKLKYLKCGNKLTMGRNSRILFVEKYHGGTYAPELYIGNNVTCGNRFSVLSAEKISIGDNCLIASDVLITSENHGMDIEASTSYGDLPLEAKPISIGKGCWIGEKVCIMPGVSIGNRCIVAGGGSCYKIFRGRNTNRWCSC